MTPSLRRVVVAGIAGNAMEWYDFAIYGYFAPIIGARFFPSTSTAEELITAFGVFAAGFLMRPIGAVLFGHIADRLGRRPALTLSVIAMAVPTMLIGVLPDYQRIGVAASLAMVAPACCRDCRWVAVTIDRVSGRARPHSTAAAPAADSGGRAHRCHARIRGGGGGECDPTGRGDGRLGLRAFPCSARRRAGLYARSGMTETFAEPAAAGRAAGGRCARNTDPCCVFGMGLLVGVSFYMMFVYAVTYWQGVVHVSATGR
jgi:hypothetical protein